MGEGDELELDSPENVVEPFFDLSDWSFHSVTTCFSNRGKVCIPFGLCCLSALLLMIACFVLMFRRCKTSGRNTGEGACSLYCLLGNLCSTVGAILSKQLAIQVFMGAFMAAVDVVNLASILFLVCLCWNSEAERRLRMVRRRRRQHLLVLIMLMVGGGGWSYLTCPLRLKQTDRVLTGRRLLSDLLQHNIEILGYILGLISFVIAWTSKLPALIKAHKGEMASKAHVFSGVLHSLAGASYTSAILLYDTEYEFVLKAMPWLLSPVCCATFDVIILILHWCRRGSRQKSGRCSRDRERLLGGNKPKNQRERLVGLAGVVLDVPLKNNFQRLNDTGHYMDVNVQPARKMCLKEVTLSREGVSESQDPTRTVRVVRVDEPWSSDTSYDSSSVNSELEWDFEAANAQWSKTAVKLERLEFPLQEWPKTPGLKNEGLHTCGKSGVDVSSGDYLFCQHFFDSGLASPTTFL
ncbi:transmembrane protein 44 [Aplochiton taeniatus]